MVFAPASLILTNYFLPLSEALGLQGSMVNKIKYISISIIIASIIISLTMYNQFRVEKQLVIINVEGSSYLRGAINLQMYKHLKESIDKGEIQDVNTVICRMILDLESELNLIKGNYAFTSTQMNIINNSVKSESGNCKGEK